MSNTVHLKKRQKLVWILTIRGFGSEINNMLYAVNFAHKKNLDIAINSSIWNFKFERGLQDYFDFKEDKSKKLDSLLYLFERYLSPLTYSFKQNNLKTLSKQALESSLGKSSKKHLFRENLLSYVFKLAKSTYGINHQLMFEVFHEVRFFNYNERKRDPKVFVKEMNKILLDFWVIRKDIKDLISEKKLALGILDSVEFATFHIRRGDKVAEATKEDRSYEVGEYISELNRQDTTIKSIFIMTDDFAVYEEIKKKFPSYSFYTLSNTNASGHDQDTFNRNSKEQKKSSALELLTEIELARKSKIFVGSKGSNIFRLIEYFKIDGCIDISGGSDEL